MRNILYLFPLILLFSCTTKSAKPAKVTLQLAAPGLEEGTQVFLTGNQPSLANWNPGAVKMQHKGKNTWTHTFAMDSPGKLEYKFTLGTWDQENANAQGNPLPNFLTEIQHDTTISHQVAHWRNGEKSASQVTGQVKYHREVEGEGIQARDIVVWLPPGYDEAAPSKYPVLYMHDGQNVFDPATSFLGIDWGADETATQLIEKGKIAPLIIVGLYNTSDRSEEYGTGPLADQYMDFVTETVIPLINTNYRTQTERKSCFTAGSSMGGLISFRLLWERPTRFSAAICMSPAFQIRDIDYVSKVADNWPPKPDFRVYIDNGGIDLDAELQPGINAMLQALHAKGIQEGQGLHYVNDTEATHNEAAWAKRLPEALQWLMNGQ